FSVIDFANASGGAEFGSAARTHPAVNSVDRNKIRWNVIRIMSSKLQTSVTWSLGLALQQLFVRLRCRLAQTFAAACAVKLFYEILVVGDANLSETHQRLLPQRQLFVRIVNQVLQCGPR